MNIKQKIIINCSETNEESCGFIVHDDDYDVIKVKNVAENKNENFQIASNDYLYIKKNHNLVGIYHSHPKSSEEPSSADKNSAEVSCLPFIIYSKITNKFSIYEPEESLSDVEEIKKILL